MTFRDLLEAVGAAPTFSAGLLMAGNVRAADVQRQLSRLVRARRVLQIRRGLYALAPPYQKSVPHPFHLANRVWPGSYVSLESALAYHGLIPEAVETVTSVGAGRPGLVATPFGRHQLRHVKPALVFAYETIAVDSEQTALVATAEKALLDLVYLTANGDDDTFLTGLRLQGLAGLRPSQLVDWGRRFDRPKIDRAVAGILALRDAEEEEWSEVGEGGR